MLCLAFILSTSFQGAALRTFSSRSALVMYGERGYDNGGGGYGRGGNEGAYERDRDDNAQVDVARVQQMVTERAELRAARDFDGADALRDELSAMGVTIFDRERTWSASANEGYGSGRPARGRGGFEQRGGRERRGSGGGRGEYVRQAGDDAPIDVTAVTLLVNERAELRAARDFEGADAVRDELQQMGVIVHDREMEWFVAGGRGGGRGGGYESRGGGRNGFTDSRGGGRGFGRSNGYDAEERTYQRAADDTEPIDVARVEALIAQRSELRAARDFAGADAVRAELQDMGVTVFDRDFKWFVTGSGAGRFDRERSDRNGARSPRAPMDFGPLGHDYSRASDDMAQLSPDAIAAIDRLLAARLAAKMSRRFDEADDALEELKQVHSAVVNDKLKLWRADGNSFPTHVRVPGDDDVQIDEAYVGEILKQRSAAKKEQDYDTADALAAQLKDELNIWLDDKRGTWRVGAPPRTEGGRGGGGGGRRRF